MKLTKRGREERAEIQANHDRTLAEVKARVAREQAIPMRLPCPSCGEFHVDVGEFATKPHHTHACQDCGMVWRPAVVDTFGVLFLPGFKREEP